MVRTREGCYSVAGAARLLGVSRQRVHQLVHTGRIAIEHDDVWHGRDRVWISAGDLKRFMEERGAAKGSDARCKTQSASK
jgi:excisionase family DNA binding protein